MEKVVIKAVVRDVTGKQVKALRREGKLPGVIYGHNFKSTAILMELRDTARALAGVTSSSIVNIELNGETHASLVREKQRDFIRGTLKHVDFQVVSQTEKLRADVAIELIGVSPAVKDFSGLVVTGLEKLEVECLPKYLPEKIVVDLGILTKIGDAIHVRDIILDKNITIHNSEDDMIAHVTLPKAEEEAVVEGVAAEEPEVIEKGKKLEEEAE